MWDALYRYVGVTAKTCFTYTKNFSFLDGTFVRETTEQWCLPGNITHAELQRHALCKVVSGIPELIETSTINNISRQLLSGVDSAADCLIPNKTLIFSVVVAGAALGAALYLVCADSTPKKSSPYKSK